MGVGTKRCYVCDTDVDKDVFKSHQDDHKDILDTIKFSNNTKDAARSACKICGKVFMIPNMRNHTKKDHDMVITEYKTKFNQHYYDLIEKVLHKCGICGEILLLDGDVIAHHLYKKVSHSISHKDYNAKYLTLMTTSGNPRKVVKKLEKEEHKKINESENNQKESNIKELDNTSDDVAKKLSNRKPVEMMNKPTLPPPPTASPRLQGFHQFLSRLSMRLHSYPALDALLSMENMQRETMIKRAVEFSS